MPNKKYITTTLPYVNSDPHIGFALEIVQADVIARAWRQMGNEVVFNTGTDEHGQKIYQKALERHQNPQTYCDEYAKKFNDLKAALNLSYTHFIRTTDKNHILAAQEFWNRCLKNGDIYKKNYQTKYCVGCELEKTDSDLVNGQCPLHPKNVIEFRDEENYFFAFSKFQKPLLELYERQPDFVLPESKFNEIKQFVSGGLQDFSISRLKEKMPWGIEVPGDSEHVIYVWFDALINYISTLGYPNTDGDFKKYWVEGTPVQYCGKDNTRFQAATWQAMLMAAGLPNSHQIVVNGFITAEGGTRMSKSLGNGVDPRDIVAEYGTDALRYFLLREISSFEDSPFTLERFKDAYNSGLANGLGNLVSRIMTMSTNYGVKLSDEDLKMKYYTDTNEDLENFDLNKFINNIWFNLKNLDEYIQKNEPFKKIKINKEEAEKDVYYLLFHLYGAALALESVIPETAKKIQELIKENKKPEAPLFLRK